MLSRSEEYNHDWVGSTEDAPPLPGGLQRDGWVLDHNRVQVFDLGARVGIPRRPLLCLAGSAHRGILLHCPSALRQSPRDSGVSDLSSASPSSEQVGMLLQVGSGREDYHQARRLLEQWRHMDLGWVKTNAPPVAAGKPLCVCAESLWLWNRMPLRIVYRKEGRHKLAKVAGPAADLVATSQRRMTGGILLRQ